jgi:hypothetical protein
VSLYDTLFIGSTLAFNENLKLLMRRPTHIDRIVCIYKLLKSKACDIISISDHLKHNSFQVLRRQIYRDLETIKKSFLDVNESFIERNINDRKKEWIIISNDNKLDLDFDLFLKIYFSKHTTENLTESTNHYEQWVNKNLLSSTSLHSHFRNLSTFVSNTKFNQRVFNKKIYTLLKDLLWCLSNGYKIKINQHILDATSCSFNKSEFVYAPLKLIIHQGSLFIGGIAEKKIVILDLCQINGYKITTNKIAQRESLLIDLENDLKNRFGVSENMDNNIYKIELELSDITGEYLKQFTWHHSQKFKLTDKGYTMTIECGINRELVSWLFSLMDNVKIIKPEILKSIYLSQLFKSSAINTTNQELRYSNVFLK